MAVVAANDVILAIALLQLSLSVSLPILAAMQPLPTAVSSTNLASLRLLNCLVVAVAETRQRKLKNECEDKMWCPARQVHALSLLFLQNS